MIDDSWNTSVRIKLGMLWLLLIPGLEIEVYGVVGKSEIVEKDGDFPVNSRNSNLRTDR